MSDCNGGPCRDWVITLAQDGSMTAWGWAAIALVTLGVTILGVTAIWLWDRLS